MITLDRWDKYSLLVALSEKMSSRGNKLGKTSLQKLIYLLKTIYNVPIDYSFKFYIYGPYSSEVAGDLDYLDSVEVLETSFEDYPGKYRGYNITPRDKAEKILTKGQDYITNYEELIDEVVELYGGRTARELELIGTIVYLIKDEKIVNGELATRVQSLKPYFDLDKIEEVISEVKKIIKSVYQDRN